MNKMTRTAYLLTSISQVWIDTFALFNHGSVICIALSIMKLPRRHIRFHISLEQSMLFDVEEHGRTSTAIIPFLRGPANDYDQLHA